VAGAVGEDHGDDGQHSDYYIFDQLAGSHESGE
jgi:hypothetical protein